MVNLGYMSTLQKMGFSEDYALAALRQTDNDLNESIDLIQNNPDILDAAIASMIRDQELDKDFLNDIKEIDKDKFEEIKEKSEVIISIFLNK